MFMDVHDQIDLTREAFLIKLIFLSRRGLQSPLDIQTLEHSSFATRFERISVRFPSREHNSHVLTIPAKLVFVADGVPKG